MTECYVVLGMHRTGTSLVSQMLDRMGVNMGDNMLPANRNNREGYWEDYDFLEVNAELLATAGGNWAEPPPREDIEAAGMWFIHVFKWLIHWKVTRHRRWGFKDPRTVLTIPVWAKWLPNPKYVITRRDKEAVIDSLEKRAEQGDAGSSLGFTRNDWAALYDEYDSRLREFLEENEQPAIGVEFERLVSRETAPKECQRLADFVGGDARVAHSVIRFRD